MSFGAPWYLLGILPWALVTILLLIGQHRQQRVPFLELWRGPVKTPRNVRREMRAPPIAVVLALGAMLLVLLAAARPIIAGTPPPIQTTPSRESQNAGIVTAALRDRPPQVMVRLRNDSDLKQARLAVGSTLSPIDLPARGQERNYFIDLDRIDPPIAIELQVQDDLPDDNRGQIIRAGPWPSMELRGQVPADVQRIVEVYARLRPAIDNSPRLVISPELTSAASVIVPPASAIVSSGPVQIQQHPITAAIDWSSSAGSSLNVASLPKGDWQVVASTGTHPILAVRTAPARQVWIGFGSESFRRSSDFVILWTNVLDWVAQASGEYRFETPRAAPKQNALPQQTSGVIEPGPVLLLIGLGMLFLSVLSSKKAHGLAVGVLV